MQFQTVTGTQETKPPAYESCGNVVFVRKDIKRVSIEQDGDTIQMWEYLEAKVPIEEFVENFAMKVEEEQETQRAQIDYIAMMGDIEFE